MKIIFVNENINKAKHRVIRQYQIDNIWYFYRLMIEEQEREATNVRLDFFCFIIY